MQAMNGFEGKGSTDYPVGAGAIALLLGWLALSGPSIVGAATLDDAATACTDAVEMIREGDLDAALDEARWCVESLEQSRRDRTLALFPDKVGGFEGGVTENQSAMGMTILERSYLREGDSINVSLTTGAAGTGLAALAQMGMNFGAASGRKMRIQKRTVIDMSEPDGSAQYMVQLKSGGVMNVSSDDVAKDDVETFLRALPITEIDEALEP